MAGKREVDLGADSDLCAIAVSMAGALDVLAADIDPLSRQAAELNTNANNVNISTTADNLLANPPPSADVLLPGDLFCEKDLTREVMAWSTRMAETGALVLAGNPVRSFFPLGMFSKIHEYCVPVEPVLEDSGIKVVAVWQLNSTADACSMI